jgi:hypothetical protein
MHTLTLGGQDKRTQIQSQTGLNNDCLQKKIVAG